MCPRIFQEWGCWRRLVPKFFTNNHFTRISYCCFKVSFLPPKRHCCTCSTSTHICTQVPVLDSYSWKYSLNCANMPYNFEGCFHFFAMDSLCVVIWPPFCAWVCKGHGLIWLCMLGQVWSKLREQCVCAVCTDAHILIVVFYMNSWRWTSILCIMYSITCLRE